MYSRPQTCVRMRKGEFTTVLREVVVASQGEVVANQENSVTLYPISGNQVGYSRKRGKGVVDVDGMILGG